MSNTKLCVDLSDKPDDFKIILFPTSSSISHKIRVREWENHLTIDIAYYKGLKLTSYSVKRELDCDLEFEKEDIFNMVKDEMIKITDTFEITKKELKNDTLKRFRWCEPFINFPEQPVFIDPYILGLWLGDGDSRSINLTNIDKVLIDYWYKYAESLNLQVSINNVKERITETKEGETSNVSSYRISNGPNKHNILLDNFKKLNLIENKHIPEMYLNNSKEIRLQVLAGLIDTDGSFYRGTYEITQKSEVLSNDIIRLAKSLGYFCSIVTKEAHATNTEAKRVRNYNRINIYMNQINDPIPVLLERKKVTDRTNFHNPTIYINGEKPKEKMSWNEDLEKLLTESVDKYRSKTGRMLVPWVKIVKEVKEFSNNSPEALRKHYQSLNKS
jgi:hypothetical protein